MTDDKHKNEPEDAASLDKRVRDNSSYIPAVSKGLANTLKHLLRHKHNTQQYPEEQREPWPGYRGEHRLTRDEEGREKCTACMLCATACPAHCIHIEAEESPWADRETYPVKFDIDELRCIYCGMCEEACPVDAIELTSLYNLTGRSREEMIFDKEKLLSVFDETKDKEPMQSASMGGSE